MDATEQHTVSLIEAAELLDMTFEDVFDEIFTRRLRSVAEPSGRRVVPMEVIEERLRERAEAASAN